MKKKSLTNILVRNNLHFHNWNWNHFYRVKLNYSPDLLRGIVAVIKYYFHLISAFLKSQLYSQLIKQTFLTKVSDDFCWFTSTGAFKLTISRGFNNFFAFFDKGQHFDYPRWYQELGGISIYVSIQPFYTWHWRVTSNGLNRTYIL